MLNQVFYVLDVVQMFFLQSQTVPSSKEYQLHRYTVNMFYLQVKWFLHFSLEFDSSPFLRFSR